MNAMERIKKFREQLNDIMYTRDCPEDVLTDFRYTIDAFFQLMDIADKKAAESAVTQVELDLNSRMLDGAKGS